ncbi:MULTISPECIES: hypothetical protein [unclassified Pseudomonas]|uniref:hypothetical protein n=1 Tax=unclassified Pseudomonas TaxID=196821 RepID=UPI001F4F6977|nr:MULTISPECIES: hypothetical protein [unclassified Pseudomonas]
MPWYKSGTVSVTLNSNAVIGTGTAFLSNGRVGDAFRGPDGGWYEITNIASDTAMAISPTYKGATAAAGSYAIAPMQGYVKDSADALRTLVNTYGAKLAALGTTGNYEVLPVEKGGTGGANQVDARTGLGLGTAAVVNIQTSLTDSTAGRVMLNGAWGWGALSSDNPTDLNAIAVSQKFGINTGALNIPWALGSTTVPFAAGSSGIAMTWTANHQSQIIVNRTASMVALRRKSAGVWAPDDYFCLYPTGQTFLSVAQGGTGVTSLTALLSALGLTDAYKKSNIVGTVSDSAGVPNGAILESGYINSCYYEKRADGSLLNRKQVTIGGGTAANGNVFKSVNFDMGPFAVPFVGDYEMFGFGISSASGGGWAGQQLFGTASTWGTWAAYHSALVTGSIIISVLAVGRWK